MPNWCENVLTVEGNKNDIKSFKEKAKGKETDLSLNSFIPCPDELANTTSPNNINGEEMTKKYGALDWYFWRLKKWGTKWDINATLTDETEEKLKYIFDSAWTAPIEWLEQVATDYPKLKFKINYVEPGVGFCGISECKNGKCVHDTWDMTDADYNQWYGEEIDSNN